MACRSTFLCESDDEYYSQFRPDDAPAELTTPRVVCAWCNDTMRDGTEPVTHSICEPCAAEWLEDFTMSQS